MSDASDPNNHAKWLAEIAVVLFRARDDAYALGQMRAWLEQATRHRSKRGREFCLANAVGWASR